MNKNKLTDKNIVISSDGTVSLLCNTEYLTFARYKVLKGNKYKMTIKFIKPN